MKERRTRRHLVFSVCAGVLAVLLLAGAGAAAADNYMSMKAAGGMMAARSMRVRRRYMLRWMTQTATQSLCATAPTTKVGCGMYDAADI